MLSTAEDNGQFSFNIMDEIFVSTNYHEGMSGAYAIIKKMCNLSKCLNIITTHLDVLASMDEVQVSKKYFDIQIDEFDNMKGDYKIRDGVWFAAKKGWKSDSDWSSLAGNKAAQSTLNKKFPKAGITDLA